MNYREVKCSDRLPKKEERYWIFIYNVKTSAFFNGKHFTVENPDIIEYWLEPYELPTEEEIKKAARLCENFRDEYSELEMAESAGRFAGFQQGVNWIINHTKAYELPTEEIRNVISDEMDKLSMAINSPGDVDVSDFVNDLYQAITKLIKGER